MSYFGTALKVALERRSMPQRQLAELAGIDPSLFSRYIAGNVRPSRDQLEALTKAFVDPGDRADIILAHLRDETPPSAADLIRLVSLVDAPGSISEAPATPEPRLPKKLGEDFRYLMQRAEGHPEIGDWISSTVDVLKGR